MAETLKIKGLGPIRSLTIKPRGLTVLIGEPASGKSLAAQVLYFFRTLESELARRFDPDASHARG